MLDEHVELWRHVWRDAVAPELSTEGLRALERGLVEGDPRLIQGETTLPAPAPHLGDLEVEAACPLGYTGWQGDGLKTVGEVDEYVGDLCAAIDQRLGEPAGCNRFLDWVDHVSWTLVRPLLLDEVRRALALRG
jgi:hypothetical protein